MTLDVLALCLEHHRVAAILKKTRRALLRSQVADEGIGCGPAAAPRNAYGMAAAGSAEDEDEELRAISDRTWYSSFVFDWLQRAAHDVDVWLIGTLDYEEWAPLSTALSGACARR